MMGHYTIRATTSYDSGYPAIRLSKQVLMPILFENT